MLRTRLSSRYFGGDPDSAADGGCVEAGWRAGRAGEADRKRRGRAVQHVGREIGVSYPRSTRLAQVARKHWHSGPEMVYTVVSAAQGT